MKSPMFYSINEWYKKGLWTKEQVHQATAKGWLTPDEYKEITGEAYK